MFNIVCVVDDVVFVGGGVVAVFTPIHRSVWSLAEETTPAVTGATRRNEKRLHRNPTLFWLLIFRPTAVRAERLRAPAKLSDQGEQEPRFPDQNTASRRPFDELPSHETGTPSGMVCFSQGEGGEREEREWESRALSIATMEIDSQGLRSLRETSILSDVTVTSVPCDICTNLLRCDMAKRPCSP